MTQGKLAETLLAGWLQDSPQVQGPVMVQFNGALYPVVDVQFALSALGAVLLVGDKEETAIVKVAC
jgi:hypothetical protein